MNERIRQLAEQADIGFYWDSPSIYAPVGEPPVEQALITPEELAKFAELIVRECAELTLDYKSEAYYNGWLDYRDEIKKHFGVE
jgi:hypothetical protein